MSSEINKSSPASIRDFLKVDEERQVLTIEPPKIFLIWYMLSTVCQMN